MIQTFQMSQIFNALPNNSRMNININNINNKMVTIRDTKHIDPNYINKRLANIQYTKKVYTLSQIYNTKGSSCSSCGGGGRR